MLQEPIKIKEELLVEIRALQTKTQESIYKMGTLHVDKMELDRLVGEFVEREKKINEEWLNLQKFEGEVVDKLVQTYGEGNLNMTDGTFTPTNPPTKVT